MIRHTVLEVFDDHVFRGQGRGEFQVAGFKFQVELRIDFAEVGLGLVGIDVGVHVGGEDDLGDSVLDHGSDGLDGVLGITESVVHTGEEVVVDVPRPESDE